jgi:hypothetical protein
MEEMYWHVVFQIQTIEQIQKSMKKPNIMDLIYEPYELSADAKKRN